VFTTYAPSRGCHTAVGSSRHRAGRGDATETEVTVNRGIIATIIGILVIIILVIIILRLT
jgi:hypothetical protein